MGSPGGRELSIPAPWAGGRLTVGDADWDLYRPVHQDLVTGAVLGEVRVGKSRGTYILSTVFGILRG